MIIEFISDYTSLIKWKNNEVREINYIWLYKQAIIPGKLIGINGRQTTLYYLDINKKSQI